MKKKDNIKNKVTEKTTEGEWIKIFNINKEEEETGEEFQGTHVDPKTGMPFLHEGPPPPPSRNKGGALTISSETF